MLSDVISTFEQLSTPHEVLYCNQRTTKQIEIQVTLKSLRYCIVVESSNVLFAYLQADHISLDRNINVPSWKIRPPPTDVPMSYSHLPVT